MITEETKNNNLPLGWCIATIEEIIGYGGLFSDGDWVESKDQDPNGSIRLIQLADIGDGFYKSKSNRFLTKEKFYELNCTLIKRNDLLVARMPDPLGRACLFPGDPKECITVVDVCIIRTGENSIDHKWLMYLINSPEFRAKIESLQSGSTRKRISRKNLAKISFPVAPLSEQQRIVDKIDELFSDLDNGIENLKLLQEKLKVYRQAVLKYAFEGKLTAEWRKKNADKLEPAERLLERIKQQRKEYYENQLEQWEKEFKDWEVKGKKGKRPLKPTKPKEPLPISKSELANFPELPQGWLWKTLDLLGILFCGQSPSGKEVNIKNQGILYVTGPEQWDGNNIIENKWTDFPRRIVPDGCIFITVKGAGVGKLFPGKECAIGRDIYAYKPYSILSFNYVFYALQHGIDLVITKAKGDIPGLSKNHILEHHIGLIPLEEQMQIVSEIETRLSVCDKLNETIELNLKKAETLRQSILKKAFEGKLVSQDPNDEPAEKLLERIKAEKQRYLEEQKKLKKIKKKTVGKKMAKKEMRVLDILKEATKPIPAKEVWEQSIHKDDIDAFYAELKELEAQIEEIREGTESLLRLKK